MVLIFLALLEQWSQTSLISPWCLLGFIPIFILLTCIFGLQINFLSQIRLSHKGDGPKVAKRLIDVYFAIFKVLVLLYFWTLSFDHVNGFIVSFHLFFMDLYVHDPLTLFFEILFWGYNLLLDECFHPPILFFDTLVYLKTWESSWLPKKEVFFVGW